MNLTIENVAHMLAMKAYKEDQKETISKEQWEIIKQTPIYQEVFTMFYDILLKGE